MGAWPPPTARRPSLAEIASSSSSSSSSSTTWESDAAAAGAVGTAEDEEELALGLAAFPSTSRASTFLFLSTTLDDDVEMGRI